MFVSLQEDVPSIVTNLIFLNKGHVSSVLQAMC